MGILTGTNILARVNEVLTDASGTTYSNAQGLEWINDAQRAVCLHRPDAKSEITNRLLVAGTKQTITGRRLLDIVRNMGSDGSTPGEPVNIADMAVMDQYQPGWHTDATTDEIENYMYDPLIPDTFYVYPQAPSSPQIHVELKQAINPTDLSVVADTIDLDDVYGPAIIHWVLYRFFSRDSEDTPNWIRANRNYQIFMELLGLKTKVDMAVDPNRKGVPTQ